MCREDGMNSRAEDALNTEEKGSFLSDVAEVVIEIVAEVVEAVIDMVT